MRVALVSVSAFAFAVGCGGVPPPATVTFGPITVPAGTERTQCVVKRLGNTKKVHVGAIHNQLGDASHHMIVYRTNDTVEQPTPFDCIPFRDTLDPNKGSPLMITQKRDELLTLPPGVAYTLAENQMLRLEMHYVNATAGDLTLTSSSTMIPVARYEAEADCLFIGNPDIKIPAQTEMTLGPSYFHLAGGSDFADAKFFAFTGHEHRLGTNVTVATASNADDPVTSVYDVEHWLWSEPATVYHDPPVTLPPDGGFRFTCSWNNTTDQMVKFGESVNNEMCFFWAYYYPSKGAWVCIHTAQGGGHDFCCPDPSNLFCQIVENGGKRPGL
jgi:hypothetical protein